MRQRLRALAATPRFTIVALVTIVVLVCGITTIFSFVNGVILRALPYPDYRRLAVVQSIYANGFPSTPWRPAIEHIARESRAFDEIAAYRLYYVTTVLDAAGEPRPFAASIVTPNVFRVLGFEIARGRVMTADESAPVAVINYSAWQNVFAGREDVIGRAIQFDKQTYTIVGVLAANQVLPLETRPSSMPAVWTLVHQSDDRYARLATIGHLAEGRTLAEGGAELSTLAASLKNDDGTPVRLSVTPLFDEVVEGSAQLVWLFFGVAALVMLIGIGNLTSLQLARNAQRRREVLVRVALGAGRARVIRELMTETVILGVTGGMAGLLAAKPMIRLAVANLPARFPRADQIDLDFNVALFAIGSSLVATAIIGFVGAWSVTAPGAIDRLDDTTIKFAGRARLQRLLVGAQTAVAVVLLVGTGLLLGSFVRLLTRDAGMQEEGLFTATVVPGPGRRVPLSLWNDAVDAVKQLPGVRSPAYVLNISGPVSGGDIVEGNIVAEGSTVDPRTMPRFSVRRVSADYFAAIGMPIKRGRAMLPADAVSAEKVAIINERAASVLWPSGDALGKRLRSRDEFRTIIGIIGDYRLAALAADLSPQMFIPAEQSRYSGGLATIIFRADSREAAAAVQSTLHTMIPGSRINMVTMFDVRWRQVALERFRSVVLLAFAATAIVLSLVGIGGLVGYTVAQRSREVAIRIALGAERQHIVRVVTVETVIPAIAGIGVGIFAAIGATRLIRAYLVDTAPLDPPTYAVAILGMLTAIMIASFLPARRATRTDPAVVLRRE